MTPVLLLRAQQARPSDADTGATINATVKDFAIAIDPTEIAGGEVTFSISNEGPSAHEFVVIETDDAPGDLPVRTARLPRTA